MAHLQVNVPYRRGYLHESPFDSSRLKVSDIHTLHYEQYGNKEGKPVIFLHGGPGGNTSKGNTEFFDPALYRVVLLDQRGAGKSTPCADLRENTTQHLIDDIEKLRSHIGIKQWHVVFGGSWGSTLALLYAQAHPEAISSTGGGGLILRGIYTARPLENQWSRGAVGAACIYPEAYEQFVNYLPVEDRGNPPWEGYYKLLTSEDRQVRVEAARSWNRWDLTVGTLELAADAYAQLDDEEWVLAHARLEAHYMVNRAWLEEGQVLKPENIDRIKHIPLTIIQGRYDIICPPRTAWELHKMWPGSKLVFVPNAGHSATEPGTRDKLIEACDAFAQA